MSAYAELVAASHFSFLRGASKPEELAAAAADLGHKALAICDRNTVAGVVRAHQPSKELGLKYIPGCRLVLQDGLEPLAVAPKRQRSLRLVADTGSWISGQNSDAIRQQGPSLVTPDNKAQRSTLRSAFHPSSGLEIACLPTDRSAWGRLCCLLTCGNRRAPKAECYLWLDDLIGTFSLSDAHLLDPA